MSIVAGSADPSRRVAEGGPDADARRFGDEILGPIFAEFAQRLWTFQALLPDPDEACLLFCARGGMRLRSIYERFLARTGLEAPLPYDDLMISRLVAARTSIAEPTPALLDELGREFAGERMAVVAAALAQDATLGLGPAWDAPFDRRRFVELLGSGDPAVLRMRDLVDRQNRAFRRHFDAVSAGRRTAILCDTGLYGSMTRILRDGLPDTRWIALQFARSNYKSLPTPHFAATVGLSVERDVYAPWNPRTVVLNFWQLIEWVLEPQLESVRAFTDDDPPRSNLEVGGWRDRVSQETPAIFGGVLAYLDRLSGADLPDIGRQAERAWRRLHRFVIWPRRRDVAVLDLKARSRDFGRTELVSPEGFWRQGTLVSRYPRSGLGALAALEAIFAARAAWRVARGRRRRG